MNNILLMTDSYKHSHFVQYPPGTEYVHSYIESRGGEYDKVLFFGLQMFIQEYLSKPITQENIDEAAEVCAAHGEPFNREGWEYILNTYKGFLPLRINAVPEGSVVEVGVPLVTVVNTDPKCFWLTSFIETALLRAVWYPTTVATVSFNIKKIILEFLNKNGTPELIDFKLHDFGARGVSSEESAGIGGVAHLVNFKGTDTMAALLYARKYYKESMAGFSIPATEHSTITSWGSKPIDEITAYENVVKNFSGEGKIYACVSDSYDIYNAVENLWGIGLKQLVIDSGGTLVIRPDSGDPVTVVNNVLRILWDKVGGTINDKGYKVLHPSFRVIQGDGVNADSIRAILQTMDDNGFSADNIAFGMGGALLQHVNRDTQKFAMKASFIQGVDETNHPFNRGVSKNPITDKGKRSKEGSFFSYRKEDGSWTYFSNLDPESGKGMGSRNMMYDGGFTQTAYLMIGYPDHHTGVPATYPKALADIRKTANSYL